MDCCKFLVLNDLRNSCRDDCCFVACLSLLFCSLLHWNCAGFYVRNHRWDNMPPSDTTIFELLSNNVVTLSNSPGACSKNIHLVCLFGSVQLELQFLWSSQIQHYSNSLMLQPCSLSE